MEERLKKTIRSIPDFPKEGILFREKVSSASFELLVKTSIICLTLPEQFLPTRQGF